MFDALINDALGIDVDAEFDLMQNGVLPTTDDDE
jgi:hypothetical protein